MDLYLVMTITKTVFQDGGYRTYKALLQYLIVTLGFIKCELVKRNVNK